MIRCAAHRARGEPLLARYERGDFPGPLLSVHVRVCDAEASLYIQVLSRSYGGPQSEDKLFVLSEVQKQVRVILLHWLQSFAAPTTYPSCESAVIVASWAIFGTAFQWSRTEYNLSSGEAADRILAIITPGLMPYLEPVEMAVAQ